MTHYNTVFCFISERIRVLNKLVELVDSKFHSKSHCFIPELISVLTWLSK